MGSFERRMKRKGTTPRKDATPRKRKGAKRQQARRVLMQPRRPEFEGQLAAWQEDRRRLERSSLQTHPIVRLTDDGPDYGTWPQEGDEVGYGMCPERRDDCFSAAIATALQHPIEQVPDFRLDERLTAGENPREVNDSSWERIGRWAAVLGLRLTFHEEVPADRDRWIGVCPHEDGTALMGDHCLVMSHDRLVFDPSISVEPPPGMGLLSFAPSDIAYGLSFDPKEQ